MAAQADRREMALASVCPICQKDMFKLTPSGQEWRCGGCGFLERPETQTTAKSESNFPDWICDILAGSPHHEGGRELLEIGCGNGERLEQAAKLGLTVMGVEPDEDLRHQARQRLPGTFITQTIDHLPPHPFDFIIFTGILETATDVYGPFYGLFAKGAITPQTRVVLDIAISGTNVVQKNIFSTPALRAFFRRLDFSNCRIAEVQLPDGDVHLQCVAQGSDFVAFMRERYVPGTWSELTEYEHLPRYDYACKLAAGLTVLDFGCGTGYGASRLAAVARHVLAVDIDERALDYARASHDKDNLKFLANADLAASLAPQCFDLITCFEVIEHVSAKQQLELIGNFSKLLKPNGVLLISTPNPDVTELYGANPYHVNELNLQEFRGLLTEAFPHIKIFLQNISASIFLRAEEMSDEGGIVYDGTLFPGINGTAIYLAACSKVSLPTLPSVVYPDRTRNFVATHMDMLTARNLRSLELLKLIRQNAEYKTLYETFEASRAEIAIVSERLESLQAESLDQQQQAQRELDSLKERLERVDEQRQMLQADLDGSRLAFEQLNEQMQQLQREFDYSRSEFERLDEQRQRLQADLDDSRSALERLDEQKQELQAELDFSKSALEQREAQNQRLQADLESSRSAFERLDEHKQQLQANLDYTTSRLEQAAERGQQAQLQLDHFKAKLEQIERSTTWRALRRMRPLLIALRPVLRPPVRFAYRAYRRLKSRPFAPNSHTSPVDPVWQPRNLQLECSLEPVWNEKLGHFELVYDTKTPAVRPDGWIKPYDVVPFHREGPAEKRILHIIPNVYVGGSTQLVIDLVQNLPRAYQHVILTSALWPGGQHTGIEIHHVATPDAEAMIHIIDQISPHLVHMHYWGLSDDVWYHAALQAVRGRGIPAVQNVNTPIAPLIDPIFNTYVFVSEYVRDHFGKDVVAMGRMSEVIHPGIDLRRFEGQETSADARNAIGMVYRLERDKLNEDSVELLIEVVRRRPRTRAYVVGGGSLLQPYLERTERAGVRENFRFTGYVPYDSLPSWYEKFRIFVAPVWSESFGQVAPFAMSKGCAVAGYRIGALAEILGSSDTLGENLDQTASLIVALLDDPETLEHMGKANHFRAQELFGLTNMIERYTAVYDRLL